MTALRITSFGVSMFAAGLIVAGEATSKIGSALCLVSLGIYGLSEFLEKRAQGQSQPESKK